MRIPRRLLLPSTAVSVWLLVALLAPLRAQQMPGTFSLLSDRDPTVSLAGLWRFQPGDNPAFAAPAFDDSRWKLIRSDDSWYTQGYRNLSGFAWYRFRVVLPPGDEPYSLLLPPIDTSYVCFVDGLEAHTSGGLPPNRRLFYQAAAIVPLPAGPRAGARTVSVAIRVWHDPIWAAYDGGGPEPGSETTERIAPSSTIQRFLTRDLRSQRQNESARLDLAALDILAGLTAFALFFLRRSEREYLYFGIAVLAPAIPLLVWYGSLGELLNVHLIDGLTSATRIVSRLAYIAFFLRLLGGRMTWFLGFTIVCIFLNVIPLILLEGFGLLGVASSSLIGTLLGIPFAAWVLGLLLARARSRVDDARLLLLPVFLVFGLDLLNDSLEMLGSAGHPVAFSLNRFTIPYPFRIHPQDLAASLFLLAMLAILINRFARTRRDQDRAVAELESARSIQQVLIPDTVPAIPGLTIATAYHPAQEVGGDFFQILPPSAGPLASGDTLIVLGDVSGKGLPAAMTVSMIVGALRAHAEYTQSPADLLAALNRRLHGRGTGFTTCIALRLSPGYLLTVANAGHLPPYRNGRELPTEPSLPLGLDLGAGFPEQTIQLAEGDRLTLLTDGVPEAAAARELFGFTRTENLSNQPAPYIAEAARTFGQTDDITVLTIDLKDATDRSYDPREQQGLSSPGGRSGLFPSEARSNSPRLLPN